MQSLMQKLFTSLYQMMPIAYGKLKGGHVESEQYLLRSDRKQTANALCYTVLGKQLRYLSPSPSKRQP